MVILELRIRLFRHKLSFPTENPCISLKKIRTSSDAIKLYLRLFETFMSPGKRIAMGFKHENV